MYNKSNKCKYLQCNRKKRNVPSIILSTCWKNQYCLAPFFSIALRRKTLQLCALV